MCRNRRNLQNVPGLSKEWAIMLALGIGTSTVFGERGTGDGARTREEFDFPWAWGAVGDVDGCAEGSVDESWSGSFEFGFGSSTCSGVQSSSSRDTGKHTSTSSRAIATLSGGSRLRSTCHVSRPRRTNVSEHRGDMDGSDPVYRTGCSHGADEWTDDAGAV